MSDTLAKDASRVIRMTCRKCWHRWFVSIPEQNAADFCRGLKCRCGSKTLGVRNDDVKRLRELVDGTHAVV